MYFSGASMIALYLGVTFGAGYLYWLNYRQVYIQEIEQRSSAMAIMPLIMAERDRAMLLQLRKNREEEAKLMENVDGWKVGTWYGEKVFNTFPEDYFVMPRIQEYYIHTKYSDYVTRAHLSFWS